MRSDKKSRPPRFRTLKAAGEFWDTHSLADYWQWTRPVTLEVKLRGMRDVVLIDRKLAVAIRKVARRRKVPVQRLIDRWLREKVHGVAV